MVYQQRQLRLRVLEALELRVKQFLTREDLWPLRVPHEPLSLDAIVDQTLTDGVAALDPVSLRSRTLLRMEWDDGSTWDAWAIVLPSKIKLYCDTTDEESRILASGGKNEGDESDRIFLELLTSSAGDAFGIEMSGGAPSRVRSSISDREFLIDRFVDLFEVAGLEADVRAKLDGRGRTPAHGVSGSDFRADVEDWLALVMPA